MIPTMMNCEHVDSGWCLDCVAELAAELAVAQKRVAVLEVERDALQIEAGNNADKAAQLDAWRDTLVNFVDQWTKLQKWNDDIGMPYAEGKASAYEHCAAGILARFDAVLFKIELRNVAAGDAGGEE
jgi:hypothetical protein